MKKDAEQKDMEKDNVDVAESKKKEAKHKTVESVPTEEYEKVASELAEYKDRYVRLYAEFENARKRSERDRAEFAKYAGEKLITEFLDILDDLERSVDAAEAKDDHASFLKGVELVMARIHEMLKRHGVKPIDAQGKPFDPNAHEILMQEETSEHADGTVIETFQKGYYLHDKVVRTAKVKVAVNPSGTDQEENKKEHNQES